MSAINFRRRGMSIIFAIFTLLVMSIVASAIFSMISSDVETAAMKTVSSRAFWAAEAGLQIGAQAVRDDVERTILWDNTNPDVNGYYDTIYLEGYAARVENSSYANPEYACFIDTILGNAEERACEFNDPLEVNPGVIISNFSQMRNLIGTRVESGNNNVNLFVKASSDGGSGTETLTFSYRIDTGSGWGVWQPIGTMAVSAGGPVFTDLPIDNGVVTWQNLMRNNGLNFELRATRTSSGGNRDVDVDYMCLKVNVEVDALTEPWASDPYTASPASLGDGQITSVTISDESGKVNINTASAQLLAWLIVYCDPTLNTFEQGMLFASPIQTYAQANGFDTVEELWQTINMTQQVYDSIKDHVTVYSWLNQDVTRTSGVRAPVNINTASQEVLQAIVASALGTGDPNIADLVGDIITQRATAPFTHMYSSLSYHPMMGGGMWSFARFVNSRTYDGFDQNKKYSILGNADGTLLNRDDNGAAADWTGTNNTATEFCYYSNSFLITAVGESGGVERTVVTTYGDTYDYDTYSLSSTGTLKLPTHIGDTTPEGYWREVR